MAIFGLILLVFFGWLAWQIVVFMAAAAVTAVFIVIMLAVGLGVVLTDPQLAYSPAAVATIIVVGIFIIVLTDWLKNPETEEERRKRENPPQ